MALAQGSAPKAQIAQFRSDGITAATGLRIPFFTDDFSRAFGFPNTRLINMISEATPLREERPYVPLVGLRDVRYSRPGLTAFSSLGQGPIRGLLEAPPLVGGFRIVVSGGVAFNLDSGTPLGAIAGADPARAAVSRSQVVVVAGGVVHLLDATTGGAFQPILSAMLPPVTDVTFLAGRFVYALAGSDTLYWSAINDAANVGGLSFATAESSPDPIVAVETLDDQLMIFGSRSVETWQVSPDPDAPFQPVEGRGYQRGCRARDSLSFADNALFWVGDNRVVYRTEDKPLRVSSSSIEDKLRQCAEISACTGYTLCFEGHELYVLNVPGVGTYAYDASRVGVEAGAYGDSAERGEWTEWSSFGRRQFRGGCALSTDGGAIVGDDETSTVWRLTTGVYQDGTDPLTRQASAFIKVEEGSPRCDNLVLHCVMGVGAASGAGSAPVAELRYSDDQGRTFSPWRAASLGAMGRYAGRARWQRLGQMRAPGRLIEVRVTDPVDAAFSHLELNAARPAQ